MLCCGTNFYGMAGLWIRWKNLLNSKLDNILILNHRTAGRSHSTILQVFQISTLRTTTKIGSSLYYPLTHESFLAIGIYFFFFFFSTQLRSFQFLLEGEGLNWTGDSNFRLSTLKEAFTFSRINLNSTFIFEGRINLNLAFTFEGLIWFLFGKLSLWGI